MKKTFLIIMAALLTGSAAFAQEEKPSHFKLYGFIRNYITADTRAVNAGTEDLYYYMPKDVSMKDGYDQNAGFNWRFVSLTTRLGLDVSGYKWGKMGISGKVEADFYNFSTSSVVPVLRLRQAFVKLNWDDSPVSLTLGQAWHPVGVDLPHMTNLESGAPFNPFNRSPQVTLDVNLGSGFGLTASVLYLNHYLPTGPAGKSKDYYKYGLPEMYLGFSYKNGGFLGKLGLDMVNSRPYRTTTDWLVEDATNKTREVKSLLSTFSPFLFLQFTKGMFQLRAKSILAQSGEQLNLLSGYGVHSYNSDGTITYTPMQDWASFVSFQYGKKFQVMCMLGYMKQFGTTKDLCNNQLWMNTAADTKIQQAFRATPTVAWNLGKFTISLEYNLTTAQFGEGDRNARGLYTSTHWVMNHRFICMTKFNF